MGFILYSFVLLLNPQFIPLSNAILNIIIFYLENFIKKMYRNLTTTGMLDHTESAHKDAVITSLKKELFELKDL